MRTLAQIASENYIEHTQRDIQVMEVVRNETIEGIKQKLWDHGLDTGKVAEALAEFRRENYR